jgi:hypothetical protein
MGRGLFPYSVDLERLGKLPKPGTPELAAIARRAKKRFAEMDEDFADEIESGEAEPAADILTKIAAGKLAANSADHGYVIEVLCALLGKSLPNPVWERFSTDFFSDLDDELTARGMKGKNAMVEIVQSGVRIGKKRLVEPECGSMSAEQATKVSAQIDAMDLSKLDFNQKKGAKEWSSWMKAAAKRGESLVMFSY